MVDVPRPQAFFELVRISGGIFSRLYGLRRNDSGRLVLAVSGMNSAPLVDDDVRTERADDADQILLGALRKTKVRSARKEELHAVSLRSAIKFVRAQNLESGAKLRPNRVLAAFSARCRAKSDRISEAARQVRKHAGTLIIRVRCNVEDARGNSRVIDCVDDVDDRLRA